MIRARSLTTNEIVAIKQQTVHNTIGTVFTRNTTNFCMGNDDAVATTVT